MEFVGKQNQKIFSWQIPKEETMKNIYVGNLPHSTTETQLRTLCEAHGKVQRVNIITDNRDRTRQGLRVC